MDRLFKLPELVSCIGQYYAPTGQVLGECREASEFSYCEEYTYIGYDTDKCGHFKEGTDGQCYMYPSCERRHRLMVYPCQ